MLSGVMALLLVLLVVLALSFATPAKGARAPSAQKNSLWPVVVVLGVSLLLARQWGYWGGLLGAALLPLLRRAWPALVARQAGGFGQSPPREPQHGRHSAMTRERAFEVLGLAEGASRDDIVASYKRLIAAVHPDKPGGSVFLARQLNEARSVLLR